MIFGVVECGAFWACVGAQAVRASANAMVRVFTFMSFHPLKIQLSKVGCLHFLPHSPFTSQVYGSVEITNINIAEGAFMRRGVFAIVLLFILGTSADAAMRVTTIDGSEVTVERGTNKLRKPNKVTTNSRRIGTHANVVVLAGPDTDAANNDYRRIQNAINAAAPGDTITLAGTFNFTAPFAAAAWALGNDNTASTG
jgi:hypothetical protein